MSARFATLIVALALAGLATPEAARAEQMQQLGPWQVHYIVLPSTTLRPAVANQYDIKRSATLAFLNLSVLDSDGRATRAEVQGTATNLLGQITRLEFREIAESEAVYYIATLHFTDRDMFRFGITIRPEGSAPHTLEFRQTLYAEPE